jgi:DNA-damage-inducible protein D
MNGRRCTITAAERIMSDEQRISPFEAIKHTTEDGGEYWSARELAPALDYSRWQRC